MRLVLDAKWVEKYFQDTSDVMAEIRVSLANQYPETMMSEVKYRIILRVPSEARIYLFLLHKTTLLN
jgi:hypothetical protein